MSPGFARFLLCKVMGWTLTEGLVPEKNCIFLEAPHTSLFDFVVGYLYYRSVGGKLRIMIKKEAFFPPVGWLLKSLGGFPIDRKNPAGTIDDIVKEMNDGSKPFHLAMCPEGTRKPVHKWKTGYHFIAMHTGAPVYLSHMDYKTKTVGSGKPFPLTGNAREDTDRIQKAYEEMQLTARHPDKYCTH